MSKRDSLCTEPSSCRFCMDPILWVEWPKSGKRLPVNAKPSDDGDIVVTLRQSENKLLAEKFNPSLHSGRRRYASHFTTCANAAPPKSAGKPVVKPDEFDDVPF